MLLALALQFAAGEPRALTPLDALHRLPWTPGRLVHYGDWNGDGVPDVAMERQPPEGTSIEVLCAVDAQVLIVLWKGPRLVSHGSDLPWDVGDLDGDGVPDLILGMPGDNTAGERAGAVQVVSGATTQTISVTYGERAHDRYGNAVAFIGDLDADGLGDYAVGASMPGSETWKALRERAGIPLAADSVANRQRLLGMRGEGGGTVLARSGKDDRVLWSAQGRQAGHAFGSGVVGLGDLDGDCVTEVLVRSSRSSLEPVVVLSGSTGAALFNFAHQFGPCGNAGDLDGDGSDDIFVDSQSFDSTDRGSRAMVISGRTRAVLGEVDYPDWCGAYGMTVGVGDLDGDGFDELALGEPDFNLPTERSSGKPIDLDDMRNMSLAEALGIESHPTTMTPESGALRVVSGRTRRPIWGVWGRPDTRDSVGYSACSIPDVSGDGAPDMVVGADVGTFVFEGPGPARR